MAVFRPPESDEAPGGPPAACTSNARRRGAYYTPPTAADFMADWLLRQEGEHVLEPSFGEGIFLRSIGACAERRGFRRVRVTGIEIGPEALSREGRTPPGTDVDLRCGDFLAETPFPVQAVIGNPPYVRLRHLPPAQRRRALDAACAALGKPMDPGGSVWVPFALHAMRFLERGGRMALVLPYELTYVRYARPLWSKLRRHFGSLCVLRTQQRLFPGLLQEVVVLLADAYQGSTDTVQYQAFARVDDLWAGLPLADATLAVDDLLRGERPFVEALLSAELRSLLRARIAAATVPTRDLVTFHIGYVAGDRRYFHPDPETVRRHALPAESLLPTLTSARALRGSGLRTSALDGDRTPRLFLPREGSLTPGEQAYVRFGEETGVSQRYKCRVRTPWYRVPGARAPDVVLSVFSERPCLMVNDAGVYASNSLLCGYSRGAAPEEIAARWYTSLTLLQCELQVHA
ncbi:MAG TPA: N-6 DNA methylase, partial [Chthonomonadaceae bacterium]|nr:N-6 DNA methylase [Chthonomonadaceae bacterium]